MSLLAPALLGWILASAAWLLWNFMQHIRLRQYLDNIPGPTSKSFFTGTFRRIYDDSPADLRATFSRCDAGDILALFHRHEGWEYTKMLSDNYQGVVRLRGPLNVGQVFYGSQISRLKSSPSQTSYTSTTLLRYIIFSARMVCPTAHLHGPTRESSSIPLLSCCFIRCN